MRYLTNCIKIYKKREYDNIHSQSSNSFRERTNDSVGVNPLTYSNLTFLFALPFDGNVCTSVCCIILTKVTSVNLQSNQAVKSTASCTMHLSGLYLISVKHRK